MIKILDSNNPIRVAKLWLAGRMGHSFPANSISEWAGNHAMSYVGPTASRQYQLSGEFGGKPWTIERRIASRAFIKGDELNGRAALNVLSSPVVIVMNRSLKESLEKQAYEIYTDPVRTLAEPSLSEEMRWIALYPECPQFSVSRDFHQAFSVLAADAVDATRWVSDELIQLVLACRLNCRDTPFVLMMLRGKVYLQLEMSMTCDELAALSNSVDIFRLASTSALRHFPKPVV